MTKPFTAFLSPAPPFAMPQANVQTPPGGSPEAYGSFPETSKTRFRIARPNPLCRIENGREMGNDFSKVGIPAFNRWKNLNQGDSRDG